MTSVSDMAGSLAARSSINEEKAAWYREVLDLEPGSKVFLPFARLLLELDRADEAVHVLRDGLASHPEFMEARLLLIDVLHRRGDAGCGAEVARLAGLFRSHPDFWDAWGAECAAAGDSSELAVSLGFLAALFRDEGLTLSGVLAAGLDALRGRDFTPGESAALAAYPAPAEAVADGDGPDSPEVAAGLTSGPAVSLPASRAYAAESVLAGTDDSTSRAAPSAGERDKCSLRTRSMAEVLAEQGDLRGAVDIYEELLTTCLPEDRARLEARLESLRERLGAESAAASLPRASASAPARGVPRGGMLDLLERLAVRLENKARQ